MVELTPEERSSLKELVDASARGESVKDFINNRLFEELSHVTGHDRLGNEEREYEVGYEEQYQVYVGLYEKGLLDACLPNGGGSHAVHWFENLTSAGRCYFEMEESAKKEKANELEEARRYARKQALIAFLASAALTLLINAKTIAENIAWLISLFTKQP